jgi:cell division protein FtsI/penicillin-binding protein 2
MAPPAKWDGLTITRMPMGQSVAATPIQMHMAMGVIASGGLLMRPQIIREVRDARGERVYRFDGVSRSRAITERTAETMAYLLTRVASSEGTAPEAAIPNFQVAGKTGTAQKLVPVTDAKGRTVLRYSEKEHVASFVGFFPASRPQIAITVIVDGADARAPGGIAYGAKVAAPSFKRIGEQLIQYLDIKPVTELSRPLLAMGGGKL